MGLFTTSTSAVADDLEHGSGNLTRGDAAMLRFAAAAEIFPDLNSTPFGGEEFQTNLIMPEPCPFLSRKLPVCSVIRPTETQGIAMNVVNFLTAMGLFIGQSPTFFKVMKDLAQDADAARRPF
jgi:hypothetical protein